MLKNPELKDRLSVLLKKQEWQYVRAFFRIVENKFDTEFVHSIIHTKDGRIVERDIDTEVPSELVDKVIIWAGIFFPEFVRNQTPTFHRSLIALALSKKNAYWAAPRGFSKTTILQIVISFLCANEMDKFIVLIEKSFGEAAEVLNTIRNKFADDEVIHACYGDMVKTGKNLRLATSIKEKDAEGDFWINGVRLKAKGFETSIRGLKSGAWRPTKIFCDDIEKDEHINSPEQRMKYLERYNSAIQPAADIDGCVKVQGTILHQDSLLMTLIENHGGVIFRAYYTRDRIEYASMDLPEEHHENTDVKMLWPQRWSWDMLQKKKHEMISDGKSTGSFTREYLNDPSGDQERAFQYQWLYDRDRRIELKKLLGTGKTFNGFAAIDVADATNEKADYTGVVVVLVDQDKNFYRVSVRRERRNVNQLIDLIFEVWQKWNKHGLLEIGVEKKAFEDQVRPLLDSEKQRRGIYPNVIELKPMGRSKENRIVGNLQGRYESGKIWSCFIQEEAKEVLVENTSDLLNELYNFPRSAHDDLSDAEAYAVEMSRPPSAESAGWSSKQVEPVDDPFADAPGSGWGGGASTAGIENGDIW